jgi:hypothetical protein
MMFVAGYFIIAFLLMAAISLTYSTSTSSKERKATAILMAGWPITLVLMICVGTWDAYKDHYNTKVHDIMRKYTEESIMDCLPHMTPKELNTLLFCCKIGAYYLDESDMLQVQQKITDLAFESQILEK